jgi:hypothetical protein
MTLRDIVIIVSKVIHISLNKLRAEQLKKYYLQKSESYPELRKAQDFSSSWRSL